MTYNFGFKVKHQLGKDNLTLILSRVKEMQTYGQLNTTLAQMCPDLFAGPADDMEQMTWLGMSEYFIQGSGGRSDSKEDYSWQCSASILPP